MPYARGYDVGMAFQLDHEAVARVCRAHGVQRIQVFGSATSDTFNDDSDVDFLVEFLPTTSDLFAAYFGLKEDLEVITDRPVDLVMADAVENPYFKSGIQSTAQDLYAA